MVGRAGHRPERSRRPSTGSSPTCSSRRAWARPSTCSTTIARSTGSSEGQIVEAYLRKTARYSISGPLVLGALLAGGPPGDLPGARPLRRPARPRLPDPQRPRRPGRSAPTRATTPTSTAGKRTLVLWTAHRLLPAAGRRALERALDRPGRARSRRRRLHGLIHESGAVDACEDRLRRLQEEAHAALVDSPLDPAPAAIAAGPDRPAPRRPAGRCRLPPAGRRADGGHA